MGEVIFQSALDKVKDDFKDLPDGDALAEKIRQKLQGTWDNPLTEDLSMLLGKHIAVDEARVIFFEPEQSQVRYYVAMMSCDPEDFPEQHGMRKVRPLAMTLVYLLHRRSWSFLEEFILHGGLDVMANHVCLENLYFRGQVIETLLAVTDAETFDWFEPKDDVLNRTLHSRMISLHNHPCFLKNLLMNRSGSYPGGSFRCLQLLAFYLSWVRLLYTQDKKLHLSKSFLEEIEKWAKGDFGEEGACGEPKEEEDNTPRGEEQKLARTLLEDFGSAPTVEEAGGQDGVSLVSGVTVPDTGVIPVDEYCPRVEEVAKAEEDKEAMGDSTVETLDNPLSLKNKGSELYRSGFYQEALDKYTAALDLLLDNREDVDDVSPDDYDLETSLHFNRATTFWKLAEERHDEDEEKVKPGGLEEKPRVFDKQLLMKAQIACQAIFMLVKAGHGVRFAIKAAYRLASIQLAVDTAKQALETVDKYLKNGDTSADMEMLRQLRRKCIASLLTSESSGTGTNVGATKYLDSRTRDMVEQLCRRKGREIRRQAHPWDGWTPPETEGDVLSESPATIPPTPSSPQSLPAKTEEDIGEMLNRLNKDGKAKNKKGVSDDVAKEEARAATLQKYDDLVNITGIPNKKSKGSGKEKDKQKSKKKNAVKAGDQSRDLKDKDAIFKSLQLF